MDRSEFTANLALAQQHRIRKEPRWVQRARETALDTYVGPAVRPGFIAALAVACMVLIAAM